MTDTALVNAGTSGRVLALRQVRVHNLRSIDLDLPLGKFIVVTGVSGAGKSSLAFDTLYAEGQRRYVESFPTYARQFLERLEEPEADFIGPIPPAIAVRQSSAGGSRRATLGSVTEVLDHLRLVFARAGRIVCPTCRTPVERHTPSTVARFVQSLPGGRRVRIAFPIVPRSFGSIGPGDSDAALRLAHLSRGGFSRAIIAGATRPLAEVTAETLAGADIALAVVDRVQTPVASIERLTESLETAFREGDGSCVVLVEEPATGEVGDRPADAIPAATVIGLDGRSCRMYRFHGGFVCGGCSREFPHPVPELFSFYSPLGACPDCRGLGIIGPPGPENRRQESGGEATPRICSACQGSRLRPEALAVLVGGLSLPMVTARPVAKTREFIARLATDSDTLPGDMGRRLFPPLVRRLELLEQVGLGYLALDRPWRTLSRGEAQRARLAGACGSNLVNLLYVLDEPTTGLHPHETERLVDVLLRLRNAGNTVVAVEHDPAVIRRADHVIDLGPQAGQLGGRVVFQGPPAKLADCSESATGDYLAGRRGIVRLGVQERRIPSGWLQLDAVSHRNLRGISVSFPLGVLCVVTGVSGSGKSSLVVETLIPAVEEALARAKGDAATAHSPRTDFGGERGRAVLAGRGLPDAIQSVLFVDAAPIGRSPRSQPAGVLGIFGEIRGLFAGTAEAKVRHLTARHFSFNAAGGGRCETCGGIGSIAVDMQFLPDVVVTCPDCHGARYRREILDVKYRGLSMAEVLQLTAREAFAFFRGRTRIQRRLKFLQDAGLEYLQLGRPARTLSGGESQRLKLAAFLAKGTRSRTLIVLDEPTTGLHPQDVGRLLDCWNVLLAAGHSLIVIEHQLDVIASADHVIDLGPGSGVGGGTVVAAGPPGQIAAEPASITGRYLRLLSTAPSSGKNP